MSIAIYSAVGVAENAYPVSILFKGSYALAGLPGSPTLGDLLGQKPVTLLSFIDVTDASGVDNQGDWLGKAESLKAIYHDLDSSYAELANILIAAVLYNPGIDLSPIQADTYVKTTRGYANYKTAGDATYLPSAILYTNPWLGSMALNLRSGWNNCNPNTPTGPFTYIICRQGATTSCYVADKIHRLCTYNGDDNHAPLTDLVTMSWTGAPAAASFSEMHSFLCHRLSEHQQAPVMTTAPRKADNLATGTYPHIKKNINNRIVFSFSEKAIAAEDPAHYIFTPAVAAGSITMPQSTDPAKTASNAWGNGTEESHTLQIDSTGIAGGEAVTLAAPVCDASQVAFATDAQFIFDSNQDTPVVEIEIVGPGAVTNRLTDAIDPPTINWAAFTINVRVKTVYPGISQPTATLIGPAAFAPQSLPFSDHAVTGFQVNAAPDGTYTILVDRYVNNAGVPVGPLARCFIMSQAAIAATVGAVEGAGYFPREELAPNFSDLGGPIWVGTGGAAEVAIQGAQLQIQAAGAAYRSYTRSYGTSYGTGPALSFPGSAISYIESCVRVATANPDYAPKVQGFDQSGAAVWILDSGIGLELANGPFRAVLRLVEASPDGATGWRKTLGFKLHNEARNVWALEPGTIDLTADTMLRMSWVREAGNLTCRIEYKPAGNNPWSGATYRAALGELPLASHETGSFLSSSVSFGRFQSAGVPYGTANSWWEYVRYGFVDERLSASLFQGNVVGIPRGQRVGEADFRRSPDILIGAGANSSTDELIPGANSITVNVTCGNLALAVSVPYKLRLFMADWDETDPINSPIAGFSLAGLANYPLQFIGKLTGTVQTGAATLGPVNYQFDPHRLDRLHRRLFLCAAIETPLHPAPLLVPAVSSAVLLPADAARTDIRYAVRQFLPDFYVRDTDADRGESPGGSLSPDIALAIFAWDPATSLPDPQSTDTSTSRFPSGFAKGEPAVYNYNPNGYVTIDSTDSTKLIKLTDSGWSDYSATVGYCNRMWVRLSNRGIVPGPANVQLFFLGSSLRTNFDPVHARVTEYEKIYAQLPIANALYVQKGFQAYDPATGALRPNLIDAVPALSGASDQTNTYRFVIAEFVWHVTTAVGISPDDAHGCRAACVNLTDQSLWSSGIDEVPPINIANSVWDATAGSNNISVRNSNIVQGSPSGTADPPYNLRALIRDNSPVNYRKLPNDFRMSFSRQPAKWGILVDARGFPVGDVVLRVPSVLLRPDAKVTGMEEVLPREKPDEKEMPGTRAKAPFRFFQLAGAKIGTIEGVNPEGMEGEKLSVFFQPHPKARPGRYEISVKQTSGGKSVGEYRTVIVIPDRRKLRYVADARTGVIYDVKRYQWAFDAIPYEHRAIFTGAGLAAQAGYRFGPRDAVGAIIGKLENEIVNVPKGYRYPAAPNSIPALPGGLEGAVIGRVLNRKGAVLPGYEVILNDPKSNAELARAVTDENGRYLLKVIAKGATIPTTQGARSVDLMVRDLKSKKELMRVGLKVRDLCIAAKEIRLKEVGR